MPDQPFDRTIFHNLEKPLSRDFNQAQSQSDRTLRHFISSLFQDPDTGDRRDGFVQGSFKVFESVVPAMSVLVTAGLAFQEDVTDVPTDINSILGLDDRDPYKPIPLLADHTFTVPTAPTSPDSRIDIIEVKASRLVTNSLSRQILAPATGIFGAVAVDKSLEFAVDGNTGSVVSPAASTAALSYKQGVAGNPGVAPATTAGYLKVCEIAVGSDVVVINDADITDFRSFVPRKELKLVWSPPTWSADYDAGFGTLKSVAGAMAVEVPITGLRKGDKITSLRGIGVRVGGTDWDITFNVNQADASADQKFILGIAQGTGVGHELIDVALGGAGYTALENDTLFVETTAGATDDEIILAEVTIERSGVL
jgi:hypothetical protein